MATARWGHSATLLLDGTVLVVGGDSADGIATASAELYVPASGRWTTIDSMVTTEGVDTATLLSDGRVLVVGVTAGETPAASTELYDPGTGRWTATGSPAAMRDLDSPRCCRMGRSSSPAAGGTAPPTGSDPRSCTTRAPGGGQGPVRWSRPGTARRRPCSPTEGFSSQVEARPIRRSAASCTTRAPGPGPQRVRCSWVGGAGTIRVNEGHTADPAPRRQGARRGWRAGGRAWPGSCGALRPRHRRVDRHGSHLVPGVTTGHPAAGWRRPGRRRRHGRPSARFVAELYRPRGGLSRGGGHGAMPSRPTPGMFPQTV